MRTLEDEEERQKVMAKVNTNMPRIFRKPFSQMSEEELIVERDAHALFARRDEQMRGRHAMQLYHLREHKPIPDLDEIRKRYEDGVISREEYRSEAGRASSIKVEHRKIEAQMALYDIVSAHHKAVSTLCWEEIMNIREGKRPKYRKRRKHSPYRQGKEPWKDPWRANINDDLTPKIKIPGWCMRKTNIIKSLEASKREARIAPPITTWSFDTLRTVAGDRGYTTDIGILGVISGKLGLTMYGTKILLDSGRMTWGQIVAIGAVFEMTPAEFCDVFLHGYFTEIMDGKWVATLSEEDMIELGAPIAYKGGRDTKKQESDTEETDSSTGDSEV